MMPEVAVSGRTLRAAPSVVGDVHEVSGSPVEAAAVHPRRSSSRKIVPNCQRTGDGDHARHLLRLAEHLSRKNRLSSKGTRRA